MRVLHLSTGAHGGAAIAGQRIHLAMRGSGIDSVFASRGPAIGLPHEVVMPLSRLDEIRSSAITGTVQAMADHAQSAFTPISGGFVDRAWLQQMQPNAIVVHNWFNLLGTSREGMLRDVHVPICFVLHDERLFTGGCHYADPCRQFETECSHCPQAKALARPLVAREQRNMRARLQRLAVSVVAPSQWLAAEARASTVLRDLPITTIANPIDGAVFHPGLRSQARDAFGLAPDELVLAWQPGKGDEMFSDVIDRLHAALPGDARLVVLHTGGSVPPSRARPVAAGGLRTEAERAQFWAAADVAFTLTAFDNFPNIALEAMACGVPYVTPEVGGAGESVRATGGGVAMPRNARAIADALATLLASEEARRSAAAAAVAGVAREYAPATIARRYIDWITRTQ